MAKYKFTQKAVYDLTQIWTYTLHKWSEDHADRYYHMLLENCKVIAINPEIGKNYFGIAENLFGFKAGRHLIFYRKINDNEVEIIRILHEQMDIKNRIQDK
jgi:toxin ParE1/3/4